MVARLRDARDAVTLAKYLVVTPVVQIWHMHLHLAKADAQELVLAPVEQVAMEIVSMAVDNPSAI